MIDVSNLKDTLKTLGFIAYGDIYEKAFSEIGCSLKVDFQAKRLIYPNEIKGRERNDSFDQKENFVVFECVCRLLSKGYRPEHIELEKEWHLGHDAKGGRADICVSDTSGNMLFIIECKTWGREYDKALNNTKSDGAQLFSYWQQEQSCKWLVLYASDLMSGCIAYKAPTIDCSDDANIILLSKKDKSIKLYRDAHTTSAKYEAWKETYGSQIHDDLIFSEDSVAYQIGVKPLRKKDLRDFTPDDKIVNTSTIATISSVINSFVYRCDEEDYFEWTSSQKCFDFSPLKQKAVTAIGAILSDNSELRELWEENEELYEAWKEDKLSMQKRLQQ